MQEEKEQEPVDLTGDDATSSETLSDVEENEDVSKEPGDKTNSTPLSPDGALNSDKSERNKEENVGPI